MIGGLVEVAEKGRHLSVYRGFLKVTEEGQELGFVPLDDITALILSGHQVTLTKALMVELAERKAIIVTCGRNWHPISLSLPFAIHFESAGVLKDQINATEPLRKRIWQQVVKAKLSNQRKVLARRFPTSPAIQELEILRRRVRSGDPENMEAQAARHYWPALMGSEFRRDRQKEDRNILLNYGYTVLRAAVARAVCGSGLHPSIGLHHGSRVNAFALVDDLMEPFRPLVDAIVQADLAEASQLTPNEKHSLVAVLQEDMITAHGASPVINCIGRVALSLCSSLRAGKAELEIAEVREGNKLL